MARRKIIWNSGDVFGIPLKDSTFIIGQVLDVPRANIARIALFDEHFRDIKDFLIDDVCMQENLISLVECTTEQLNYNVWKIIGNKTSRPVPISSYPNEMYRNNGWINSITHGSGIIERFVNAFYRLTYWDDFFNPTFLDQILIDLDKKPKELLFKSKK